MPARPLKPCPFCGKADLLYVDELGNEARPFFAVACGNCEAEGPVARTSGRASDLWNTRLTRKGDGDGKH